MVLLKFVTSYEQRGRDSINPQPLKIETQ